MVSFFTMHILQIYKDYPPVLGGIENHLRDLSEGLAARGHYVTVLVTSLDGQTRVEQPNARLRVIKAARTWHMASTPLSLAMFHYARMQWPDVIHLHFPYPPGDLVARATPGGAPLVLTYHSDIVRQRTLLRAYRPLLAWTLQRASRIIATSPNYIASSHFLRRYSAKCAVVPLGVDTARFAQADAGAVAAWRARHPGPLLLFVGRLRYYKGLHILLDALPHIRATLLIAGSGPEQARLMAQARERGLDGRVHFLGDVADADLPALYHAADLFVLPAHLRAEALGIVQIEALAAGLPCVSTELGTGTTFVNCDGETGLTVPPGDSAALARAIGTLLDDPARRRQMGQAGHRRATTLFSHTAMLDGVERVYRTAVQAGGSG